jgi:Flp pilus assembly pilin Flp
MLQAGNGNSLIARFLRDDSGQDLLEYAILTALVGVGSVLLFSNLSTLMNVAYTAWNSDTQDLWHPCDPGLGACP